jgi:hypothetical protein
MEGVGSSLHRTETDGLTYFNPYFKYIFMPCDFTDMNYVCEFKIFVVNHNKLSRSIKTLV